MADSLKKLVKSNLKLTQQVAALAEENRQLRLLLSNMNRKMFGISSEKSATNQLSLFEEEDSSFSPAETTANKQTVETEEITYKRKKSKGRKVELTEGLPCKEHIHEVEESDRFCDCCGTGMSAAGKREVRTEVEFIPATLVKHVHYEQSYECKHCKVHAPKASIKTGTAPKPAIQNSLASPSILAWLFHQKIEMSLPFHRQEKEWDRYGLSTSRRTLANWFIKAAQDWLHPLCERMRQHLANEEVVHADETVYQILNRSDKRPATSESRIWLFRNSQYADHPIVLYHSSLTRQRQVALDFLKGFSGFLHCDGYSAYQNIPGIVVSACWAHLRRKFIEAGDEYGHSAKGVDYCNQLFALERELKQLPNAERLDIRRKKAKPIVESFWRWVDSFHAMKGNLSKAIQYALKLKEPLERFLTDGRLVISNNLAEQAIRPITVGRKNWNFSTSEAGADANCYAYSIIQTAIANGLDAYAYLKYLFEHLPNLPDVTAPGVLDDFLPWSSKVKEALT